MNEKCSRSLRSSVAAAQGYFRNLNGMRYFFGAPRDSKVFRPRE
jgi:hypothetical protein